MAGDKALTLWREAGEPERVCSGEGAAPVAPKSSPSVHSGLLGSWSWALLSRAQREGGDMRSRDLP